MSDRPAQPAMLSFRPKTSHQLNAVKSSHNTATANGSLDAQSIPDYLVDMVDKEKMFSDVARLAIRAGQESEPPKDIDLSETQHRIKLKPVSAKKKQRAMRFGLKPSTTVHEPQVDNDQSDTDGLDDLNRMISEFEATGDGIVGEIDFDFDGVREFFATEDDCQKISHIERTATEKAMRAARSHGGHMMRNQPDTYEELAQIQQNLFNSAGNGRVIPKVHHTPRSRLRREWHASLEVDPDQQEDTTVPECGGEKWNESFLGQTHAENDEYKGCKQQQHDSDSAADGEQKEDDDLMDLD